VVLPADGGGVLLGGGGLRARTRAGGGGPGGPVAGLFVYGRGLSNVNDTPATFLSNAEDTAVVKAIEAFEKRTSGELRVHLESKVEGWS